MTTFLGLTCLGWYLIGLIFIIVFNEIIHQPMKGMGKEVFFAIMPRSIRIPYSLSIINFIFPILAAFFVEKWYHPLVILAAGWLLVPILSQCVIRLMKGHTKLVMAMMPITLYLSLIAVTISFIVLFI